MSTDETILASNVYGKAQSDTLSSNASQGLPDDLVAVSEQTSADDQEIGPLPSSPRRGTQPPPVVGGTTTDQPHHTSPPSPHDVLLAEDRQVWNLPPRTPTPLSYATSEMEEEVLLISPTSSSPLEVMSEDEPSAMPSDDDNDDSPNSQARRRKAQPANAVRAEAKPARVSSLLLASGSIRQLKDPPHPRPQFPPSTHTASQRSVSSTLLASGIVTGPEGGSEDLEEDDDSLTVVSELVVAHTPTHNQTTDEPSIRSILSTPTTTTAPVRLHFTDHAASMWPSHTIRQRGGTTARVLQGQHFQVLLTPDHADTADPQQSTVTIRSTDDRSVGVLALHCLYTIFTLFWLGTLLVFALQVLLLTFLHVAREFGLTESTSTNGGRALGVLLSLVPLLRGLPYLLALAGAFVTDTFRGHRLLRQMVEPYVSQTAVVVDWVFFGLLLGIPLFALCMGFLSRSPRFWEVPALMGVIGTMILFWLFVIGSLYHQMTAFAKQIKKRYPEHAKPLTMIQKAVYLRQVKALSGVKRISYVTLESLGMSTSGDTDANDKDAFQEAYDERISVFSRLTTWSMLSDWGLYRPVDLKRVYDSDESIGTRRYITSPVWSLEGAFCNLPKRGNIMILNGPGALTKAQVKSTAICLIIGVFLAALLALSFTVYLAFGSLGSILFFLALGVLSLPHIRATYRLSKVARKLITMQDEMNKRQDSKEIEDVENTKDSKYEKDLKSLISKQKGTAFLQESEGVNIANESFCINRPSRSFAMVAFVLEELVFFVWPVLTLLSTRKASLGIFVILLGILERVSNLFVPRWRKSHSKTNIEDMNLATRRQSRNIWRHVLAVPCLVFLMYLAGTIATDFKGTTSDDSPSHYLTDWEYIPSSQSVYSSCELTDFYGDSQPLTSLTDLAFLAAVPYRRKGVLQQELDSWFVDMGVKDQTATVEKFRQDNDISAKVSFNLVTVPIKDETTGRVDGEFAFVLIRGSIDPWDYIEDFQTWGVTVLYQVLRVLLPFGEVWTPILPYMVRGIATIEGSAMDDLRLYQQTRKFVSFVKQQVSEGVYKGVSVVGHSLGGGLAIINGAQEGVKSFALSAPNTMLTRKSIEPAVSAEALDQYTFNVIPDRDITSMMDDPAKNVQEIRCIAEKSDTVACNHAQRSFCEILYSCGTGPRPVLCDCAEYGYPLPTVKVELMEESFEEACGYDKSRPTEVARW